MKINVCAIFEDLLHVEILSVIQLRAGSVFMWNLRQAKCFICGGFKCAPWHTVDFWMGMFLGLSIGTMLGVYLLIFR